MTARPDTTRDHPAASAHSSRGSGRRAAAASLGIFVLASLLYLPTLHNEFVWDDVGLIEHQDVRTLNAATIQRLFTTNFWETTETHSGLYRPLTALTFHTDYQLYGRNPGGFHFTNVWLNGLVCVLVFLVLREMFARPDIALVSALLFAAFPMHTENVAWVSGRTDVIATLFMLASLGCYARWRRRGGGLALAGGFVFFALALLGKEIAVVLPAVVGLTNLLRLPGEQDASGRSRARWGIVAGMVLIAAGYLALRREVLGQTLVSFPRFTTGFVPAAALTLSILAHYAYRLVYPFRLDAEADFLPPETFFNLHTLAGIAIVVATMVALVRWRRKSAFVFGTTVMACGLAPVLNILPLNQVLAERFLYFPSLGWVLLVSLFVAWAMARRRVVALLLLAAFLAACTARTVARTFDWKDELTLFQKTVAVSGDNARARASLGSSLYKRGRYPEALAEFERATELNPSYAPGWSGRARAAAELGRTGEALEYIRAAIELDPGDALLYHHLGVLQFQAGQYAQAVESFRRALEIRPRHLHARFNLGLALYQQRDFDGAVRELSVLENKDTDFVRAWFFLAESEYQRGNFAEAARAASHFLTLSPDDDALNARAREIAGGSR